MAKRTEKHDDMSKFGNRLIELMENKGEQYNSGRKLASALYEGRYFSDIPYHTESDLKQKEIWKIEKQITKHMGLETGEKVNGKYLIAYSLFFGCSTDYLLGITDIKSNNQDIRLVCEITGLSDNAVENLISSHEYPKGIPLQILNEIWSALLESDLSDTLRIDYVSLCRQLSKLCDEKAEIEAWDRINENLESDFLPIHRAKIENMRQTVEEHFDVFYGRLNKMLRDISVYLERHITNKCLNEQRYNEEVNKYTGILNHIKKT